MKKILEELGALGQEGRVKIFCEEGRGKVVFFGGCNECKNSTHREEKY